MPHLFDDYDPEAVPYYSDPDGPPTTRAKRVPEEVEPVRRDRRPPGALHDLERVENSLDLGEKPDPPKP